MITLPVFLRFVSLFSPFLCTVLRRKYTTSLRFVYEQSTYIININVKQKLIFFFSGLVAAVFNCQILNNSILEMLQTYYECFNTSLDSFISQ